MLAGRSFGCGSLLYGKNGPFAKAVVDMLLTLAVSGYRSLRDLVLPLERLTVVTGANGSGKSSLYRSVRLLADVAQGHTVAALAREGGLSSTLWAGPEGFSRAMKRGEAPVQGTLRRESVALRLGFSEEDFGYAIDLGLPKPSTSLFARDPEIKAEALWAGEVLRRGNALASRRGPSVQALDDQTGERRTLLTGLPSFESMMTHAADPRGAPEVLALRERMRAWRFYDHLRTDEAAPARRPQVGTRTHALASDGSDFPAALQTLREIGDTRAFDAAVSDAFPGSAVEVEAAEGVFAVTMRQHGLLRPLRAAELSDGTLRYLLLAVALLSPRPPPLLVLNEPETSLHPSLLPALARLIAAAAARGQVLVVSHARPLLEALAVESACLRLALYKTLGETLAGKPGPDGALVPLERPRWTWPQR